MAHSSYSYAELPLTEISLTKLGNVEPTGGHLAPSPFR